MNSSLGDLGRLFSSDGFVPRRVCGSWPDWLVCEHVGGNALVWLAYIAMPLMIWRLGVSWPGWRPFKGLVLSFALFIGLCGVGHFLDMLAFYRPMYRLSGHVLVATGLASCWTAWSLQRAWPVLITLRKSEEKFRQLADAMPHLVWTARPDGHPDYYNERWYALTGQPRGIGGDESWLPVLHPDDVARSLDVWHHAVETAESYRIEYRFKVHQTGEYRWHLGRALPVKDESGRVVRWFGTCTDIHEERLQAEALWRSEEKFRQLAESIPQLVWMARPDGHISWYNRRWYDYTGTTPEDMEGWGWRSVHDPATLPEVLERWVASVAAAEPFEMTFPLRGADGRFRQFLTRVLPTRDAEGVVLGWIGTNTDVDEQKRVEEALRESEERLQLLNKGLEERVRDRTAELRQRARLIDQAHDAIVVRSKEGVILSWNQGAERLYGWTKAEALGRVSHELLRTRFPGPLAEIEEELATLGAWEGELIHETRDGVEVVAASRWIVDRDGSAIEAVLEINSDITARKEVEGALRDSRDAAMAATRAKGDFLANMSHEIRTPMNGVVGMTDLLLDTRLDDLQRSYAETIRGSGEALLGVINDILDFSKIEAGKLTLVTADFDLRALMEEVADLLTPGARRKGLEFTCRVAPEIPPRLVGDPVRVRQVLTNLAGNAVKFTDRGEVGLEAQVIAEDGVEATLRILVRDTGIGIPADRQADVFESFTQVEGGNSRRHGGTGLGLAICRSLVALMGGRIGMDSQPGEGSTFWFEVAFANGSGVEDRPAVELAGLSVLVVVDQESDRQVLREMLLSWGCQPEELASGVEALARLLADPNVDPFRLILLDRDMPGMDGEQTARAIRAAFRCSRVPLVLVASPGRSGAAEVEDGLWAARISKPLRRSRLYNILCQVVAAARPPGDRPPADGAEVGKLPIPLRLLLVEDNEVNRQVAVGMLGRLGCEVEAVWNGREALDALDHGGHDLVLMDVQMPEMDGFAATAAIRERERGTGRHMPIIAMTAHAMQGDRQRCLAAGMDDYLSKPIRFGPLREALLAWGGKIGREVSERGQRPGPESPPSFAEGLRASCGEDPKLIRQVLDLMLKGVPVRLGRLEAAVVAGDGGQVVAEAHSLKGAFATVGARALAESCEELISLGEGGDPAAIDRAYQSTRIRWERLREEANLYLTSGAVASG